MKTKPYAGDQFAFIVTLACVATTALAADTNQVPGTSKNLSDLTLDQLVNIQVTSVSKKEENLFDAPAAIYVITQEDIQRSGATSLEYALRMVPGMDVAQINADNWAISARGFNGLDSDSLLVLVDGRSVYTPVFAGVNWGLQDMLLEDLDRIEVIRGPGATLWGANAVNGVINIISKSARDTQGLVVSTAAGTEPQPSVSLRYGGELATNFYYRVYAKYDNDEGFQSRSGQTPRDGWNSLREGFRLDWEPQSNDHFTLQGEYFSGAFGSTEPQVVLGPPYTNMVNLVNYESEGDALGRWTHDFSDTSQLSLQVYYDHPVNYYDNAKVTLNIYDVDLQHRFLLGNRNDFIWGLGYRDSGIAAVSNPEVTYSPERLNLQLFNAFLQDDVELVDKRLNLILGLKFEHNDFTGFEVEPGGRLLWTPTEKQTVWAAVSRAVRTPSVVDTGVSLNVTSIPPSPVSPPVLVRLEGNPNFESEDLIAYELG